MIASRNVADLGAPQFDRSQVLGKLLEVETALSAEREIWLQQARSRRKGWDKVLLGDFADEVERVTGRPHYGHLAYLLEAAYLGHGRDVDISPVAIRFLHRRLRTATVQTWICPLCGQSFVRV